MSNRERRLSVRGPERIGLTILPGRKDYGRDLSDDIVDLKRQGVTHIVCLVPDEELANYGVAELLSEFNAAGFSTYHLPIVDQKVCSAVEVDTLIQWINAAIEKGGKVLLHCVAGLGRSGMVAGAYLRRSGMDADASIAAVRAARTARAIESGEQEEFVKAFF